MKYVRNKYEPVRILRITMRITTAVVAVLGGTVRPCVLVNLDTNPAGQEILPPPRKRLCKRLLSNRLA